MENEGQEIAFSRFLENYEIREDEIDLMLSNLGEPEENCGPENFKVSLGGDALEITEVSTVEREQIPVTIYCLVDVSGSMKEEQMNQVKETLLGIRASMTGEDNMVICTMGNETKSSGFLTAGEELDAAIGSLASGNEDTNLYQGIVNSIRILQTDQNVHTKRCLLILSDGDDEQVSGITEQEAKQAVADSGIPVYTVATLRQTQSEEQLEYAKLLGSFSRMSAGGQHFAPVLDGKTAEETGTSVADSLKGGIVVSVRTDQKTSEKDVLLLRVVYETGNGSVLEDTVDLYAEDLPVRDPKEEEPEEEPEDVIVVPEATEAPESGKTVPAAAGAGILIILVCLLFLLFMLKRRKRKGYWNAASSGDHSEGEKADRKPETDDNDVTVPGDGRQIELKAMGGSGNTYQLHMEAGQEITLGRNQYADVILDADDRTVSGTHCKISSIRGRLMLEDLQSMNGTLLNGTTIQGQGRVELHDGDVLKIGHTRYEVRFTEDER